MCNLFRSMAMFSRIFSVFPAYGGLCSQIPTRDLPLDPAGGPPLLSPSKFLATPLLGLVWAINTLYTVLYGSSFNRTCCCLRFAFLWCTAVPVACVFIVHSNVVHSCCCGWHTPTWWSSATITLPSIASESQSYVDSISQCSCCNLQSRPEYWTEHLILHGGVVLTSSAPRTIPAFRLYCIPNWFAPWRSSVVKVKGLGGSALLRLRPPARIWA